MTAVGRYSEPDNRTRSFSLIRMAINLGWSIGPAAGGLLIASVGYRSLFWVDGLTCIAAGIFFVFALREKPRPADAEAERADAGPSLASGSPYRDKPYLIFLLVTTLSGIIFMQMITTLPVYFNQEVGLREDEIGALMALNGVLIVLLEMPIIFSYERQLDRMNAMGWGVVLYGLAYVLFNFFPLGFAVAIVSMVALSFGEMLNMPLANTFAMSRTTEANRGRYMGLYAMTFSIAHIVGPSFGFGIAGYWGFPVLWYLLAALSLVVWAGYAWLKRRRPAEDLA
jgi:predicted MFS family arabinose efflux permease